MMPKLSGSSLLFTRFTLGQKQERENIYQKKEPSTTKQLTSDFIKTIFFVSILWIIFVDHTMWSESVFWGVHECCGSTKYISYQTFLCIRSVLSLLHYDKRSSQIVLLRLWIEATFTLFIRRHAGKTMSLSSSGEFPKRRAPPQQAERSVTVTEQPPGSIKA